MITFNRYNKSSKQRLSQVEKSLSGFSQLNGFLICYYYFLFLLSKLGCFYSFIQRYRNKPRTHSVSLGRMSWAQPRSQKAFQFETFRSQRIKSFLNLWNQAKVRSIFQRPRWFLGLLRRPFQLLFRMRGWMPHFLSFCRNQRASYPLSATSIEPFGRE